MSYGEANESAYFYERNYTKRLEGDNSRVTNERNQARSEYQRERDDHDADNRKAKEVADELRRQLLEQNNKHLKTTIKFAFVTVGIAATTWALGKFGIL